MTIPQPAQRALDIPKIVKCLKCGKKPKEIIFAMGYSDKDDEFYLVHWCNAENKKTYYPKLKQNPFTAYYVNGQRPRVIAAWNEAQVNQS